MNGFRRNKEIYCMIYLSHCLSAWGDRMWDFAVGLYMVILYPESLLLTAILGFVTALSVITFGSLLGLWIDKTKRITSATASIIVQNVTIALAGVGLAMNFVYWDAIQMVWNGMLQIIIFVVIILASVIAKLSSVTSDIAIERDWVVVLTEGDESSLATMNSVMRTIDLTTKILAPAAIGALISYSSAMTSAIFIAGWNAVSGVLEVYLLILIYRRTPELQNKRKFLPVETNHISFVEYLSGWKLYFNHPVKIPGVAFSCLFMSALGFDQITIGFMYSQGVDESLIGILTACGAIVGIIGSISYPFLRKCLGKNATAVLGYISNSICLFLCVISIFLPGSPFEPSAILDPYSPQPPSLNHTSASENSSMTIDQLWLERRHIFYFIAGIVLARFGLWVADLSTAQLLQDSVEESKRGVINGIQNSMNQLMDMIKFLLVIILPSSRTFGYLTIATWLFSCIGATLYSAFVFKTEDGKQRSLQPEIYYDDLTAPAASSEPSTASVNERTPLLQTQ